MQAEKPMIHQLFPKSVELVKSLVCLIVEEERIPDDARLLAQMKVSECLRDSRHCFFGPDMEEMRSLVTEVKNDLEGVQELCSGRHRISSETSPS